MGAVCRVGVRRLQGVALKRTKNNPVPAGRYATAVRKYTEFQAKDPRKAVYGASICIPTHLYLAGSAEWVFYASRKWGSELNYYMHEHGWGVKTYLPGLKGAERVEVPQRFRDVECTTKCGGFHGDCADEDHGLVLLGQCRGGPAKMPFKLSEVKSFVGQEANTGEGLGFIYTYDDGSIGGAMVDSPYPDLYCTPDGKCLLVIENHKKIRAMIWGGSMCVKDVGIVG